MCEGDSRSCGSRGGSGERWRTGRSSIDCRLEVSRSGLVIHYYFFDGFNVQDNHPHSDRCAADVAFACVSGLKAVAPLRVVLDVLIGPHLHGNPCREPEDGENDIDDRVGVRIGKSSSSRKGWHGGQVYQCWDTEPSLLLDQPGPVPMNFAISYQGKVPPRRTADIARLGQDGDDEDPG